MKNCKEAAEKCKQFWKLKKLTALKHFLALPTYVGSEMHAFRVVAKTNFKIFIWVTLYFSNIVPATCFTGNSVTGACSGDSGGPALWEDKSDNKRAYLMGIIIKGFGLCGQGGPVFPNVYVWVPFLRDWILSKGGNDLTECLP